MRTFKDVVVFGAGLAAAVYLVYPSFGVFELLPDALPLVGSLDEASATVVLVSAFRYFGVDLSRLFKRDALPSGDPPPHA